MNNTQKQKTIIFWILFLLTFLGLLLLATFYDYKVSSILADLHDGSYYSKNVFGMIFESVGEFPIYAFLSFATMIIALNFTNIKNKFLKYSLIIIFVALSVVALYVGINKISGYVYEHHENLKIIKSIYFKLIYLVIAALLSFIQLTYFKGKNFSSLLSFAIIIIITFALSQGFVQGIKPIFGRERFRAIYYFNSNNLNHNGFTRWYIVNGSSSALADKYNVQADYFKSFPSGHTCAAGIVYTLILIPYLFPKYETKKYKIIFLLSSICYTGIVAVSRIIVGAHYFSDVLVGGTSTFLSTIAAFYIYKAISNKILKEKEKKLISY